MRVLVLELMPYGEQRRRRASVRVCPRLPHRISALGLGRLIAEGRPAEIRAHPETQKVCLGGIA